MKKQYVSPVADIVSMYLDEEIMDDIGIVSGTMPEET